MIGNPLPPLQPCLLRSAFDVATGVRVLCTEGKGFNLFSLSPRPINDGDTCGLGL